MTSSWLGSKPLKKPLDCCLSQATGQQPVERVMEPKARELSNCSTVSDNGSSAEGSVPPQTRRAVPNLTLAASDRRTLPESKYEAQGMVNPTDFYLVMNSVTSLNIVSTNSTSATPVLRSTRR